MTTTDQAEPVEVARPARLSLSEIVRLMLTRSARDYSGVTLTQNVKGGTQIEVAVRTGDDVTVEGAEIKAAEIYDRLRERYPHTNGETPGATVTLTRNAKGETQISAELKGADLDDTADALRRTYDKLRMKYPMLDGFTARPGSVA
jgi:phage tail sheath gpL-like